jgi:hypothetical protein
MSLKTNTLEAPGANAMPFRDSVNQVTPELSMNVSRRLVAIGIALAAIGAQAAADESGVAGASDFAASRGVRTEAQLLE